MPHTNQRIKQLLNEPESNTLDVKRDQYPFAKATAEQKGEIIKDIISFANTPRTTDAHILLGITEQAGKRTITGITNHPDDAHLQQLINSKTNRPIQFTYQARTINGKAIGIITIPPHKDLTYLKHDYGNLRAKTIYIRHGSSTAIATPDEIQQRTPAPTLDLQFANPTERTQHGKHQRITSTVLHTPEAIPHRTTKNDLLNTLINSFLNPNYDQDLLAYATFHQFTKPFSIAITNTSSTTAHDVHLQLTIPDPHHDVTLSLHAPPLPTKIATTDTPAKKPGPKRALTLERTKTAWHLTSTVPKIRPQQTVYPGEPIYLGATKTMTIKIAATIHADNLPAPITTTLTISLRSKERTMTLNQARRIYDND